MGLGSCGSLGFFAARYASDWTSHCIFQRYEGCCHCRIRQVAACLSTSNQRVRSQSMSLSPIRTAIGQWPYSQLSTRSYSLKMISSDVLFIPHDRRPHLNHCGAPFAVRSSK
ncbi:hypothetical protein K458DRAFT_175547 [Lentithecium fluviatile CBS 122367]|uniref:Uncharacterized protein n=1 Tax=Lentithecium fluviatile CBS 122367 TaxID=1168545 RepID=A0A6G1JC21_9PLEO|nr:hypothetical protein K458DRAFT_175547 [Lentithecium fluviatile CBS 122367]